MDADKREVLVLRRSSGEWKVRVIRSPEVYRPRRLPGFEFSCEAVFQEADKAAR